MKLTKCITCMGFEYCIFSTVTFVLQNGQSNYDQSSGRLTNDDSDLIDDSTSGNFFVVINISSLNYINLTCCGLNYFQLGIFKYLKKSSIHIFIY